MEERVYAEGEMAERLQCLLAKKYLHTKAGKDQTGGCLYREPPAWGMI